REDDLPRSAPAARGRSLPLARSGSGPAGVLRGERPWRRGRDGGPAPRAARRRCAVPPRVRAHRAGPRAAGQLPGWGKMTSGAAGGGVGGPEIITRAIDTLASGHDLGLEDTAAVLREIMAGNATEIQIAAFLIALRTKGETVEELAGLA